MMRNEARMVDWTLVQRKNKQIHFSNSPGMSIGQSSAALFLCGAGCAVSLPSGCEGMARQGALPSSVQCPHLLAKMRKRLPARHPNSFSLCPGSFAVVFVPLRPQS